MGWAGACKGKGTHPRTLGPTVLGQEAFGLSPAFLCGAPQAAGPWRAPGACRSPAGVSWVGEAEQVQGELRRGREQKASTSAQGWGPGGHGARLLLVDSACPRQWVLLPWPQVHASEFI